MPKMMIRALARSCVKDSHELFELSFKGYGPVMHFLIIDVCSYLFHLRFRNGDREIVVLPIKLSFEKQLFVQPMCRFALDEHHQLRDILLFPKRDEQMNVIRPAADRVQEDSFLPTIVSNMGEEF